MVIDRMFSVISPDILIIFTCFLFSIHRSIEPSAVSVNSVIDLRIKNAFACYFHLISIHFFMSFSIKVSSIKSLNFLSFRLLSSLAVIDRISSESFSFPPENFKLLCHEIRFDLKKGKFEKNVEKKIF